MRAHTTGLRHKAVSVFVMSGDAILLQRRALNKYHTPGLWANTCCTHPHWDEVPATCASRRLTEELGINGLDLVHRGIIEYRADVGGDMIEHEVVDLFTAQANRNLDLDLNPDEVAETAWVSIADLHLQVAADPDRFTPWLRIYLAEHAARIFDAPV
jgi:isopentenyl-diphosphate delta-isomerase